jgi:ribosomal-protein-alanine acetyltransferase
MTLADLDRVVDIEQSLRGAPHWPLASYIAALNPASVPRRIALVAANPETGVVAGFLVASVLSQQGELETIAVASEAQRRGVGRQLFTAMVEEMCRAEVQDVILEVRASNLAALGFYRDLGFVQNGRRPRYYADPVEDAVLLKLVLD